MVARRWAGSNWTQRILKVIGPKEGAQNAAGEFDDKLHKRRRAVYVSAVFIVLEAILCTNFR